MIQFEIRKAIPVGGLMGRVRAALHLPQQQQQPTYPRREAEIYMPKITYAGWIEGIKEQWALNMVATYKAVPIYPNFAPHTLFKVVGIEEICWNAPIDPTWNEPKALTLKGTHTEIMVKMPPSMLRPLTKEELDIVAIRDKPKTAPIKLQEIDVGNGRTIYRDPTSGEIL